MDASHHYSLGLSLAIPTSMIKLFLSEIFGGFSVHVITLELVHSSYVFSFHSVPDSIISHNNLDLYDLALSPVAIFAKASFAALSISSLVISFL
jgi:hypothetical protein